MDNSRVRGLRIFLLEILSLIAKGEHETLERVEELINSENLVQYLAEKYSIHSSDVDMLSVEDYYRQYAGCCEGRESHYYVEGEDSGLFLVIALGLNEL